MIVPRTIACPPPHTDPSTLPMRSEYLKQIEDCKSDEEFYNAVDEAIMMGEFGHVRDRDKIISYMIRALLYSPRRIVEYIESNTDPDTAWEIELERGPCETVSGYTLLSPMKLEAAYRKIRIREIVIHAYMQGDSSPDEVFRSIHPVHPDIDMSDILAVFSALSADGIIG